LAAFKTFLWRRCAVTPRLTLGMIHPSEIVFAPLERAQLIRRLVA
jgi:hypothetical protein